MRYQEVPLEEIFEEADQPEGNFGEFDLEEQEYESWEQEGPPAGGSRNSPEYVRWIQISLNKILGLNLKVDGIIGPMTRSAIRSFQQKQGLAADGVVGSLTENALRAKGAIRLALTQPTTRPQRKISSFAAGSRPVAAPTTTPSGVQGSGYCSTIPYAEPTQAEKRKIDRAGAKKDGDWEDVTHLYPTTWHQKPLIAVKLTHYDKNDWVPHKEIHRHTLTSVAEKIEDYLQRNPNEHVTVTITGHCSKTGSPEYNQILSCKRANGVRAWLNQRLNGRGYDYASRTHFNTSGSGFTEAKCGAKGPNPCEDPYYRQVLIVAHAPNQIVIPIPPDPPRGWCKYKIRCCSFKSETLLTALLSDLLSKSLPKGVREVLEKYPFFKKIFNILLAKLMDWLKKMLPKLSKFERLLNDILKYIVVELIRVNAVFQIVERDKPVPKSAILCYVGFGFRVKIPDIPRLNKVLDDALEGLPVPEFLKKIIKDEFKKLFKKELEYQHLESKCAGVYKNFDLVRLVGSSNMPVCTEREITVFQGDAAVGTSIEGSNIVLSFETSQFTRLTGIRLSSCSKCWRHAIELSLGQASGFEFFVDSRGTLSPGVKCQCVECSSPSRILSQGLRFPVRSRKEEIVNFEGNFDEFDLEEPEYESWEQEGPAFE